MRMSGCYALLAGVGFYGATFAMADNVGPPNGNAAAVNADASDPFLWLEQVDSPRALEWVKAENAKTSTVLQSDARYGMLHAAAITLAQANDRIPEPAIMGGEIYNLWQDEHHAHGLWRRTGFADFMHADAKWGPLLDLDALSESEHANWFWSGAHCSEPGEHDCMIALSDGGEDAVTEREFDVRTGRFVEGGFLLPKGKQDAVWQDEDTLLVGREWNPGDLTSSGYPYIIKQLKRGQPLAEASEIYRGEKSDVGVSPAELRDGDGNEITLMVRYRTFFETDYGLLGARGVAPLALPAKSGLVGLLANRLIVELREDWHVAGKTFGSGSLVSIDMAHARNAPDRLHPTLIYAPEPRHAFGAAAVTRDKLLLTELDNVRGRAFIYSLDNRTGAWTRRMLPLPDNITVGIVDTDLHSNRAFFEVTGFTTPASLWLADLDANTQQLVRALPPRFDSTRLVVEQLEATSKDGTRVPYFVVRAKNMPLDGSTPLILEAYGGFQISETPDYSATLGKLWLERGGAYALANIRGGGEFGPAWHDAGLKLHRQRIYDDFAAVGEDLIARKYTSAPHLGIRGGSNGGLLMGVEFNQRPDLWGAVEIQVPLLDMLRYEQIDAGASWVGEYGSVSVPEERAFLASISPYHNLHANSHYPLPLIWSTSKDDRVGPQHARKFAAKMASMNLPYLFYEVLEGGHSDGATLEEKAATGAREYTYFSRQLGLP